MGKYESPAYQVIKKDSLFEIREYESFSTVSVSEKNLSGTYGFNRLFGYIQGSNQNNQKMSMTIPVINDMQDDTMTMEFVIPAQYRDQPPIPNDQILAIKEYPKHLSAVLRFSGKTRQKKVLDKLDDLRTWTTNEGYSYDEGYLIARYNSPFSLPFLRRNEVIIRLSDQS